MVTQPFSAEFQRKILYLALTDDGFAHVARRYIRPEFFEADSLRWVWKTLEREFAQGRRPTLLVIRESIRTLDPALQPRYRALVDAIAGEIVREEAWIRSTLADWVRRNLFVQAFQGSQRLYNRGQVDEAYRAMYEASERIHQVTFESPRRSYFYEQLDDRLTYRRARAAREWEHTFPTGIEGVDEVLDGGLSRGELGLWLADSKGGKSMMLRHLAAFTARALMRRVLVILLEGRLEQAEAQIDTYHAKVLYKHMKRGVIERDVYQQMIAEYTQLRGRLIIRAMTDKWTYTAADIRAELDDLRATEGWVPDELVVDYGDLLRSQNRVRTEEEHQRDAFGDLKTITGQDAGYAMWTASQVRRLKDGGKQGTKFGKPVFYSRDIADSYNKIRRVDFIGSINQDDEEREQHIARLLCDRYRDNAADRLVMIKQDLARMTMVVLQDTLNQRSHPQAVVPEGPL
jgi:replicative DNA helicase